MNAPRVVARLSCFALAGYGALHLLNTAWLARNATGVVPPRRAAASASSLQPAQEPLVSALTRVFVEDGVPDAERWATAIVRASPTSDTGYLALVAAQIRRESAFLARDLEWLFSRLVPQLVHDLGVKDPVRTVGPMQVQRWRLAEYFERTIGRSITPTELKSLAGDIEFGVASCVAVLDRIVIEHFPDRRVRGLRDYPGPFGFGVFPGLTLARDFLGTIDPERRRIALHQKLLSDLQTTPLALDGIVGESTRLVLEAHPELATLESAAAAWAEKFQVGAPTELAPRITHDPRLAFVFADFNAGVGACRTAALQALLRDLLGVSIACDGKMGPETRAAMGELFARFEKRENRREDFAALIATGDKPDWVGERALALARDAWRDERGVEPPEALVPDLWSSGITQEVKGLGRISVEGYVAGSEAFFEDYLNRISRCLGLGAAASPRARLPVRN